MSETISMVLIDSNRMQCEGISALIQNHPDLKVLAAAGDIDEALRRAQEATPQIVLVNFGNQDCLHLTATVHGQVPEAGVIVMGVLTRQQDIAGLVRAGVSGFVMKDASFHDLLETVRTVAAGGKVLPHELTDSLFVQLTENGEERSKSQMLERVGLTRRERQVIDLICEGLCNKEIAARLRVAIHTVKCHVHNILEKLELSSRLEIAAFSRGAGSTTPRSPQLAQPQSGDTGSIQQRSGPFLEPAWTAHRMTAAAARPAARGRERLPARAIPASRSFLSARSAVSRMG